MSKQTAMRLCDELIQAAYDADICSPGDLAQRVRKIKAAISKPERNCDRCKSWEELWQEFSSKHCPNVTDDCQRAWLFIRWLFAKATKKGDSDVKKEGEKP